MAAISYQPWWQGCTDPVWDIPLNNDSGPDDLVASNVNQSSFSMTFRTSGGVDTAGTGTFSVKFTNPAEVLYQPSANDVSKSFAGQLFIKASTLDTPARTIVWDPISFIISAA